MKSYTATNPTRRTFLAGASAVTVLGLAAPAHALTLGEARALIDRLVAEINSVINSGRSEAQMYRDFEAIFRQYADVARIAPTVLGPAARTASQAQLRAYADAFTGYIARKYGKRFREFIGGEIIVQNARALKSFYEVNTTTVLRGEPPFEVTFFVTDRGGRNQFFDMRVEGISLLNAEREEIQSMLDRRRGNIDALIQDLRRAG